jgi:hypothetical protein
MSSSILAELRPTYVDFDPTNAEHLEAFRMLCVNRDETGTLQLKQHPSLRFKLDRSQYSNVRDMMLVRVGEQYLRSLSQ